MQWQRSGLSSTASAEHPQGTMYFLPRPAAMLQDMLDHPDAPWPQPPGSATPTSASAAVYRTETGPHGSQLVLGLDDEVQAAAVMVPRPRRWYALTFTQVNGALLLHAWQPHPGPTEP